MKPLFLIFAGLLAFIQGAAPALADTNATQPIISARIKCLSMEGDLTGIDILLENAKRLPVPMSSNYISTTYLYQGPAKLIFIHSLPKPTATKDTSPTTSPSATAAKLEVSAKPQILATVELPPAGGDFLLLFSGNTTSQLNVLAVPFSSADVPAGSCLVWNVTPRTLGLVAGGQRVVINSSQRELIKPAAAAGEYFDLRIFDEYQGKVRPLVGGPHFLPPTSRQLLFIVEKTPGQAPILIRTIEEIPEIKKPRQDVAINR